MITNSSPRIAFDDVGDGDTALLFMPGWGASRSAFRPLYEHIAASRRLLALDWRGHGGSEPAAADFGMKDLALDALSVLEFARVKRVVPVGLAHAGWVAIELRKQLGPSMVPGVVLLDWMVLGAPPAFGEALVALQDPQKWSAVRDKLLAMWTTGVSEPRVHAFVAEMGKLGFDMWSRAGREIARAFAAQPKPLAALAELSPSCPTLHLFAQPDDPAFLAAQRQYASAQPWFRVQR
ncbi:MAG TPA: alpha/beta hydrolase, partial [Polyangiaceae bacterium]|nr:alpha/beta hydrolase [Polyangiaceae bacterium]